MHIVSMIASPYPATKARAIAGLSVLAALSLSGCDKAETSGANSNADAGIIGAAEQQEMLQASGFSRMEDLFAGIPEAVKLKKGLDLPAGKSELEVSRIMEDLAARNTVYRTILRGAGAYHHYIPAIVKSVTGKDVVLNVKVDPSIIGGLIVKLGSRMVDSSLRTKLNSIKHAMKEAG